MGRRDYPDGCQGCGCGSDPGLGNARVEPYEALGGPHCTRRYLPASVGRTPAQRPCGGRYVLLLRDRSLEPLRRRRCRVESPHLPGALGEEDFTDAGSPLGQAHAIGVAEGPQRTNGLMEGGGVAATDGEVGVAAADGLVGGWARRWWRGGGRGQRGWPWRLRSSILATRPGLTPRRPLLGSFCHRRRPPGGRAGADPPRPPPGILAVSRGLDVARSAVARQKSDGDPPRIERMGPGRDSR